MLFFVVAYRSARRAMAEDQCRFAYADVPTWRLLLEEVALLARRVGRWKVTAAALTVGISVLAVEVALSEDTPGPALAAPARWVAAVAASLVSLAAWSVVHAVRRSRTSEEP